MLFIKKNKDAIRDTRRDENVRAQVEKQGALLEYVAIMADVVLPEEGEQDNGLQ